jgi:Flp pilus assembly protein CpaB
VLLKWRVLAAAIAGLIAVLLLYQRERDLEKRAFGGQRIPVVIAKTALKAGTRLQDKHVESMDVPELYLHPQSIRVSELGQVLDRPLAVELKQGQPIQWTDFSTSERERGGVVPKGLRGAAIQVMEFIGKSGLAAPGSRVDVLGTFGGGELKGSMTVTLLQNVLLIDIAGGIAMLALELEEAELLTFAATHGTVSLLLRNAEDLDVKKDIPPKSWRSLIERIQELQIIPTGDKAAPPGIPQTAPPKKAKGL